MSNQIFMANHSDFEFRNVVALAKTILCINLEPKLVNYQIHNQSVKTQKPGYFSAMKYFGFIFVNSTVPQIL